MPNENVSDIISILFDALGMRKYIGMRYVPIFGRHGETTMDWDNTKPYEQLTVVLHNGNSYTSKQFVPIGVDITNTDFWALSGNYNAQVEEYKQAADSAAEEAHTATENVEHLESLLPDTEFTSEITVKQCIDTVYDMATENKKSLYKISPHIDNASLLYRNVQFINSTTPNKEYMQGGCVFPANDDWDSGPYYIAYITNTNGQDTETTLHIIDIASKTEVSSLDLSTGHGGIVSYTDNHLIIPRYTNNNSSPKQLLIVDVTIVATPTITDRISWENTNGNVRAWFAYQDTTVLGYGTPENASNVFGIYSWDYTTNQTTWLFDLVDVSKYGKRRQPPIYDSSHDCIIMPYADCTGFDIFDMTGHLIAHKSFEPIIGFVTLGEIEWVCTHNNKIWFAGQHGSGKGTILSQQVFEYDTELGGFGFAAQGYGDLNTYTIRLNQNNGSMYPLDSNYSTATDVTLMVPEDALNMARYLEPTNDVKIILTSNYDCCICIHDYSGQFSFNNYFATRGAAFYAFTGLLYKQANFANVDPSQFLDTLKESKANLSVLTPDNKPVWCLFNNCNFTMSLTGDAYTHDASYYKFRFIGCSVAITGAYTKPCYDMLIDSSIIEFACTQPLGYCKIGASNIRNAKVLIGTFDIADYIIKHKTEFDGCFIVDGVNDDTKLLANTAYYFGDIGGSSLHGYNFQPIVDTGRRQSVCDRLHNVRIPFVNSGVDDTFIIQTDTTNKTATFSNELENMTALCMFG